MDWCRSVFSSPCEQYTGAPVPANRRCLVGPQRLRRIHARRATHRQPHRERHGHRHRDQRGAVRDRIRRGGATELRAKRERAERGASSDARLRRRSWLLSTRELIEWSSPCCLCLPDSGMHAPISGSAAVMRRLLAERIPTLASSRTLAQLLLPDVRGSGRGTP
jgi:hypothetical protein